jgi:hypothetical protein
VLADGFGVAGTTGRPWHPQWYAAHLEAAGLTRVPDLDQRTWRLIPGIASELGVESGALAPVPTPRSQGIACAGKFGDPRLVLPGIAAVPDLTPARNSAMALARRAKRRDWEGCTIVVVEGDPASLVTRLRAAAFAAGYRWIVSPWSPDAAAPPETVHSRFTTAL